MDEKERKREEKIGITPLIITGDDTFDRIDLELNHNSPNREVVERYASDFYRSMIERSVYAKQNKLKGLADTMYHAAQNLSTDASKLKKAMEDYRQFVINELRELQ